MTSLPISNNKPQPSSNAANALQANIAADSLAMDAQPAEPFAFLLARQIGETDLSVLTAAQTAITIDRNATDGSADPTLKDAQNQAAATTNTTGDPANTLAAILLQLSAPEDRGQKIEDKQTMQPLSLSPSQQTDGMQTTQPLPLNPFQKMDGMQATQSLSLNPFQKMDGMQATQSLPLNPFQQMDGMQATKSLSLNPFQKMDGMQATQSLPLNPFQKTDGMQATQPFALSFAQEAGHKRPMTASEDSQIIQLPTIDYLPSEAAKRAELLSGLAQPVPNTAQAIASPTIPAAMPGMLTNNLPAGTPPTITTPLGNNGWADEFSQKISWISTQQNQVAELHLNPPNLGPLDVVLKISDNQATALFTSPHGAVRDAVENALPKLREILADNGIMLGNTTISDQPPRDRSTDEFMNQGSGTAARHEVSGTAPEPTAAQTAPVRRHNGMVDTFA